MTESYETLDALKAEYAFKINPELSTEQKYQLLQLLWDHKQSFARDLSEIGHYEHYQMTLEPLSDRKSYRRQFRLPIDDAQEAERQIEQMRNNEIIEPSDSIDYNSPVFLVNKKSAHTHPHHVTI